jgi:hypothetical protein
VNFCTGGEVDTTVVATINGNPIIRSEFDVFLSHYRGKITLLKQNSKSISSDSVKAILIEAIQKSIDDKLRKLLAVENGIIEGAGYHNLLSSWHRENEMRKQAKKNNKIFYGPVEFSLSAFYDYQLSQINLRLKEILAQPATDLSESRVLHFYDSVKNQQFTRRDTLFIMEISLVESNDEVLNSLKLDLKIISDSAYFVKKYICRPRKLIIDDTMYRLLSEDNESFLQTAVRLKTGEVSSWQTTKDNMYILKCLNRQPGGYIPFDDVRGIIHSRLVDETYSNFLMKKLNSSKIKINSHVVDRIVNDMKEKAL